MATELLIIPDLKALHLVPVTPHDQELIAGLRADKHYKSKLTWANPRSVMQNRFYWGGILGTVIDNHPHYTRPEPLHLWLKVRMGYVEQITFHDGVVHNRVDSTAFDKMPPDEFKQFLDNAILILCNEVLPGLEVRELRSAAERKTLISYRQATAANDDQPASGLSVAS